MILPHGLEKVNKAIEGSSAIEIKRTPLVGIAYARVPILCWRA
jgi:hypothetical protein